MSEKSMISLTPAAVQHIAEILLRHQNGIGFRLSVKKTGCSGYQYDPKIVTEKNDEDCCFTEAGMTIFIDRAWLAILNGTIIDLVEEDLGQKKLIYKNPNVDDECGCGESFNIRHE